jgi:hypothetical protein
MIHASPAKSGETAEYITSNTLSNSVTNSLILAAKNGVKKIIFPFIGGGIFLKALQAQVTNYTKESHAKLLVKGVDDFYINLASYGILSSPIEKIYFVPWDNDENNALTIAYASKGKVPDNILESSTTGSNIIEQSITINGINAIVNAGNVEHSFSSGAGIASACFAGLNKEMKYQKKLNNIKTKFIEAFNAYIKNHSTAAPSHTPAPEKPKVAFAVVLKELVGKLDDKGDPSVDYKTLGVKDNFLYPTDGDESAKKNLNSAAPAIDIMIKEFENADGGDTNFYLGACRSIEAAYKLDETEAGLDDNKKIRAKLLLNLRKNSLLLKVPRRWDYATMNMVEVPPPPTDEAGLMKYSLEKTIEYYSQEGGDKEERFKELNIAEEPTEAKLSDGATISGVDGRFTKGIQSGVGQSCFFVTCLQYLMCNEDFLQLMIEGNCNTKSIEKIEMDKIQVNKNTGREVCTDSFDKNKTFINNLLLFFKKWINGQTIDNEEIKPLYELYKIIFYRESGTNYRYGAQEDSTEVLGDIVKNLDCLDNIYVKKFLNNGVAYDTTQKTSLVGSSIDGVDIDEVKISAKAGSDPINPPGFDSYPKAETDPSYEDLKKSDVSFYSVQDTINNNTENQPFVLNLDNLKKFELRKNVYDSFKRVLGFNQNGIEKNTTDDDGSTKTESQSLFGILYYLYSQLKNSKELTDADLDNLITIFTRTKKITLDDIDSNLQNIIDNIFKNYLVGKNIKTREVELKNFTTDVTYPIEYPEHPDECEQNKNFNLITSRVINFQILYPVLMNMIKILNDKLNNPEIVKDKIKDFIKDENNKYLIFMIYRIISDFMNVILTPYKTDGETYIVNKETIRDFGKYIMFYYKRTSFESDKNGQQIKYKYGIDINETITANGKKYVLVGFTCHYGDTSKSGHYDCIKCDKNGKPILGISDSTISIYRENESIKRGVVAVIYKRADELGQSGGGRFKPRHNPLTNHSKSKHNSSFKASSSSKSKGKSHSRSHTQRVK